MYQNYYQIKLMRLKPKPHFFYLHLSITDALISSKSYDKRNDIDSDIVNFLIKMRTFPVLPLTMLTFSTFVC